MQYSPETIKAACLWRLPTKIFILKLKKPFAFVTMYLLKNTNKNATAALQVVTKIPKTIGTKNNYICILADSLQKFKE